MHPSAVPPTLPSLLLHWWDNRYGLDTVMSSWTADQLEALASSDDLHIAPYRPDGVTAGTPTWIWSVVVDGDLYVRAYNGTASRWHRAALQQHAGQIRAVGSPFDVAFEPVTDAAVNAMVDQAYSEKYRGSQYLPPMVGPRAGAATVRVTPSAS